MPFDFQKFLDSENVEYRESGKNWQAGWLQICCPFCGDTGFHGGCNLAGYFHCWRCGGHRTIELIRVLADTDLVSARVIYRDFSDLIIGEPQEQKKASAKICRWPPGTEPMLPMHRQYLESRGFEPSELSRWHLRGTGPVGDYKFRVIVPIFVDGVMISYQGRDITGKQSLKYKTCKTENEVIHHKHAVYGGDHIDTRCIIVEGVTDVWRLGPGTICLFGIQHTPQQIQFLLRKGVQQAAIVFDPGAEQQSEILSADLEAVGISTAVYFLEDGRDPAELNRAEAAELLRLIESGWRE